MRSPVISSGHANVGLVSHHLAQAYEASGDNDRAREILEGALEAHDAYVEAQRADGASAMAEPTWYAEAQAMKQRL